MNTCTFIEELAADLLLYRKNLSKTTNEKHTYIYVQYIKSYIVWDRRDSNTFFTIPDLILDENMY